MTVNAQSIHTYPTTDDHITEGLDCWCSPTYMLPCDECGDADGLADLARQRGEDRLHAKHDGMRANVSSCWKCEQGLITLSRTEAGECSEPMVIVHNR
jgi:hypothetical protein